MFLRIKFLFERSERKWSDETVMPDIELGQELTTTLQEGKNWSKFHQMTMGDDGWVVLWVSGT